MGFLKSHPKILGDKFIELSQVFWSSRLDLIQRFKTAIVGDILLHDRDDQRGPLFVILAAGGHPETTKPEVLKQLVQDYVETALLQRTIGANLLF